MPNETYTSRVALRLGFWSALGGALTLLVFTVCFTIVLTRNPIFTWTNMADYNAYVAAHPSVLRDLARLQVLLLGPCFVVMLNSIHEYAPAMYKPLTRISLMFGLAFALLTGVHYWVQLTTVRLAHAPGSTVGLEQIVQANPYGAIAAINMLGWTLFLGLASLAVAPVFRGGRLERVARWSFIVNGICCLLGGLGYVLPSIVLVFLTIDIGMGGALTTGMLAVCLLFRRLDIAARDSASEHEPAH